MRGPWCAAQDGRMIIGFNSMEFLAEKWSRCTGHGRFRNLATVAGIWNLVERWSSDAFSANLTCGAPLATGRSPNRAQEEAYINAVIAMSSETIPKGLPGAGPRARRKIAPPCRFGLGSFDERV